jgi:uncharacterized membrane protein
MSEKSWTLPRWRRIALPVSIVLNLFLLAVIGGHVWHNRRAEAAGGMPLTRFLANVEASLPARDAAAFGEVIKRNAPHYGEDGLKLLEARKALAGEITAEPYDQARVRQALANWRAAWNQFMDDFGDTLVEALGQVSPEGRRKLIAERRLTPPPGR